MTCVLSSGTLPLTKNMLSTWSASERLKHAAITAFWSLSPMWQTNGSLFCVMPSVALLNSALLRSNLSLWPCLKLTLLLLMLTQYTIGSTEARARALNSKRNPKVVKKMLSTSRRLPDLMVTTTTTITRDLKSKQQTPFNQSLQQLTAWSSVVPPAKSSNFHFPTSSRKQKWTWDADLNKWNLTVTVPSLVWSISMVFCLSSIWLILQMVARAPI